MPTTEFGSAVATRPRPPGPDLLETVRGNRNTGFERDEHGHADIFAQSTKREQRTVSADAGTAMGGRMCVGRSVFAVRLRTPSPTLLRAFCRWRSGATPVTTVPPSLANRMLPLLICVAQDAVIMLSLPHVI